MNNCYAEGYLGHYKGYNILKGTFHQTSNKLIATEPLSIVLKCYVKKEVNRRIKEFNLYLRVSLLYAFEYCINVISVLHRYLLSGLKSDVHLLELIAQK